MKKLFVLHCVLYLLSFEAKSQVTISGTTCVTSGTSYQYSISGTWNSGTHMNWCVTGGTITGTSGCKSGTPVPSITVVWNAVSSGSISLTATTGNASLSVTIITSLSGKTITAGKTQTINYNSTPASITCPAATGGACSPSYTYQWQQSPDAVSYTNIVSATGLNLTFSSGLTQTTYYRRKVVESSSATTAYSDVATITVNPALNGNVIGPAVQDIFVGDVPQQLGGAGAYGGSCTSAQYTYQWQLSSDNVTFNPVNSNGTGTTYSPLALNTTTYYRRVVTCGTTAPSSVATVNVHTHLATGSITGGSSVITYGTTPNPISGTSSTGGICGSYTYTWYQSSDNASFSVISGATFQNYAPGAMTNTMYFKRKTDCGSESVTSNTVSITVMPQLTGGSISGNTGPLTFNNPPGTLTGTAATGGNCGGTYLYQWQMSYDGTNFTNIIQATGVSYTPDPLIVNAYFRRLVSCNVETQYSNALFITVNPQIYAGSIAPGFLTVASGTSPGQLTSISASGGNCGGAFNYQWQSSTDNFTWADISGATGLTYTPGSLVATTYYRKKVVCGTDVLYTNVTTIAVGSVNPGDLNYIRIRDIKKPLITDAVSAGNLTDPNDVQQTTQYLEGLGNVIQVVAKQTSPLLKDVVSTHFVDGGGREGLKFMPYVDPTTDGNYKLYPNSSGNTFNQGLFTGESGFYTMTDIENSGLNRTNAVYSPGSSWVGSARGTSMQYQLNDISDSVKNWVIASAQGSTPTTSGNFAPGTLRRRVSTDEQGHQSVIYTDLLGRTLLKKVQLAGSPGSAHMGWGVTYYVYDDLDNLRFVITPRGMEYYLAGATLNSVADELCFRYEYDQRKRMIVKKIPGSGEMWMVYDTRDRVVMTQDANLRTNGKWMVTEYDMENRAWRTGLLTDGNNRGYHQNLAYSSTSYPSTASGYEVLTQTYFEDYSWVAGTGSAIGSTIDASNNSNSAYFATSFNSSPTYAQTISPVTSTRSLTTGSMTKVLGTTNQYLYSVNFYDDRNRIIQTQTINVTGGNDIATSQYDFSGKLLRSLLRHQKNGSNAQNHLVSTKYNYDANARLLSVYKNIDNAPADQLISTNTYNELGQLQNKSLGTGLDNLAYNYNVRGWLTSINKNFVAGTPGNYFGMELGYDKTASVAGVTSYANAQFNGNIAGTVWKTAGDGVGRKYDFAYDNNLNRLTGANFTQDAGSAYDQSAGINFSVSNLSYDLNGNILTMNQMGFTVAGSSLIDQLSYTYQTASNKLLVVGDGVNNGSSKLGDFHYSGTKQATDYSYDANGNLGIDNNKAISAIAYNHLNLPTQTTITAKGTISYTYDASGMKLIKTTVDNTVIPAKTTVTRYLGPFIYQAVSPPAGGTVGPDTLQFINLEEGRARWAYHKYLNGYSAYGYEYDFFERDHLGNTRVVLTQQKDTAAYLATGETAYQTTESQLFSNLTATEVARTSAPGYPNDVSVTNPNNTVFKLNGSGNRVGPGLLLKVMSGDKVDLAVQYYYNTNSATATTSSLNDVLASLANGIVTLAGGTKGSSTDLNNTSTSPIFAALNSFFPVNDPPTSGKPKAYLNWILLDEQLKNVTTYPQSGAVPVAAAGLNGSSLQPPLGYTGIPITKSGYLYIWVSNETQGWDVFFDNLSVKHYTGPMLEETHYYPFGLSMAGISDKALKTQYAENKYRFQKQELQNKEFSDGSGLEMYEFKYRFDDCQIGRFWSIDPLASKYEYNSPYAFSEDKVTTHVELEGLEAEYIFSKAKQELAANFQAAANWVDNAFSFSTKSSSSTVVATTPVSTTSAGTTVTTATSTNAGGNMSYIIAHNSNDGNPESATKTTTTTTADTKTDIKVPGGVISNKTSVDNKGVVSNETGFKANLKIDGVPVPATLEGSASTSTDGQNKITAQGTIGTSTQGVGQVQYSTNGKQQGVSVGAGGQQKAGNTTVTTIFRIKFSW